MVSADSTVLTDRQVEVLQLRERGLTQQEVADRLGTTDANISAIERAARENIEKARATLELVRTIRAPIQFSVSAGASLDELVDEIYERGDDADIGIDYPGPKLHAHLYESLESYFRGNKLETDIEIGISEHGDVDVFTEGP